MEAIPEKVDSVQGRLAIKYHQKGPKEGQPEPKALFLLRADSRHNLVVGYRGGRKVTTLLGH